MTPSPKSGFTLIELMIVVAIIAIIAAIAIPNLMQSRLLANEATAVSVIKSYATAQVTFQVGKQGADAVNTKSGVNGYCDNFRNLFYGNPKNDRKTNLALLSQAVADAFALAPAGNAAATQSQPTAPTAEAAAYQGYMFSEPKEMRGDEDSGSNFAANFAMIAVPFTGGRTGNNLFWVDQQGTVWLKSVVAEAGYADSVVLATPSAGSTDSWWAKN